MYQISWKKGDPSTLTSASTATGAGGGSGASTSAADASRGGGGGGGGDGNRMSSKWVIVMPNMFYDRVMTRVFDLKGSERNRKVAKEQSRDTKRVLLDQNLMECMPRSLSLLSLSLTASAVDRLLSGPTPHRSTAQTPKGSPSHCKS
jgi:hypothetical protein